MAAERSSAFPAFSDSSRPRSGLSLLAVRRADDLLRREAAFLENRVGVVLDVERPDGSLRMKLNSPSRLCSSGATTPTMRVVNRPWRDRRP